MQAQGIDPGLALRELHVADAQGRIHRELDAYLLLLSHVRLLRPLSWLIGLPGLRRLLSALYRASVLRRLRASGRARLVSISRPPSTYFLAPPAAR